MDSDNILLITLMIQNCLGKGEEHQKQSLKMNWYCTELGKGWLAA